jgi:predicted dienelactone hydrolase
VIAGRTAVAVVAAAIVAGFATAGVGYGQTTTTATAPPTATTAKRGKFPLIAPLGLRPILDRERRATRRAQRSAPSTTTVPPSTTTQPPPPTTIPGTATPYHVGVLHQTFVDPSRGTPARGGNPSSSSRHIATTIYYPTNLAPTEQNPRPRAASGPFPLIVFAHGYAIDAAAYEPLLRDVAAGGFVVAAPDFPGTSTAYGGGAIRSDSLQQPGDISFVITSILDFSAKPGLFFNVVNPNAVGDSGQSDGGVTAAAAAYNTCCIDPRIEASVILTGGSFGFDGQWFPPGTPPVMFVHATADEVNPYSASTSMFAQAQSPKYLMTIEGGDHLQVYVDPPWEPQVAAAMIAFFDVYLKGDPAAAARLDTAANQPGYSLQLG